MARLEDLRGRIRAAEDLHAVVGTMKGVAAVNVRRHERSVLALAEYGRTVGLGLQALLRSHPELLTEATGPDRDDGRPVGLVVFGSEQGLCGPLNRHVAAHARRQVDVEGTPPRVIAVGARMARELEDVGLTPELRSPEPASSEAIAAHVQDLLVTIDRWRADGALARVVLVHARPAAERAGGFPPTAVQLWPLSPTWLAALARRRWPSRQVPGFALEPARLLAGLVRHHLFVTLHRAYAESSAAVNASRVLAMQAAEQTIEQRLEELRHRYHRVRQATITEEILDVVAGYETAVTSSRRSGPVGTP